MIFNPDQLLNFFNARGSFITELLLRFNIFPSYIYGARYLLAMKKITEKKTYEKKLIDYVNKARKSSVFYSDYPEIDTIQDFKSNVRFIDKQIVLDNFNDILNVEFDKSKFVYGTTSGTSGSPMKLYIPRNRYYYELSCMHSIWKSHGWNYETRGVIRNHKLFGNKIFTVKPFTKEIVFDAFRLDKSYAKDIHDVLVKKKIKFLQAYPSSAYLFCKICKDLNLDLSFLKCIFTSSEPLLDFQREFIETDMNLNISSFYGHSEKLIIAGDNQLSKNLQFENFYGYVELIDSNGNEIKKQGEVGELVGTGFHNNGMFLIRYRTGDFAEYVGDYSENYNKKGLIVKNIEGHRNNNIIYKKDNTYTTTTALNLHGNLYDKIDGLQYFQRRKGHLIVRLIKNKSFNSDDEFAFYEHFNYAMGEGNTVEINFVDELELNKNGKFSILISKL